MGYGINVQIWFGKWKWRHGDQVVGCGEDIVHEVLSYFDKEILIDTLSHSMCLTLCDPVVHSPPGSSVRGILQAKLLEWIAIPFFRGSS